TLGLLQKIATNHVKPRISPKCLSNAGETIIQFNPDSLAHITITGFREQCGEKGSRAARRLQETYFAIIMQLKGKLHDVFCQHRRSRELAALIALLRSTFRIQFPLHREAASLGLGSIKLQQGPDPPLGAPIPSRSVHWLRTPGTQERSILSERGPNQPCLRRRLLTGELSAPLPFYVCWYWSHPQHSLPRSEAAYLSPAVCAAESQRRLACWFARPCR